MGRKIQIEEIRSYIESFNYILFSDIFENAHVKLSMQCDKGHKIEMSWNNFKNNKRCKKCDNNRKSEMKRSSYSDVKLMFEEKGYKLLTVEYINNHQQLQLICPNGHNYNTTAYGFKKGCKCDCECSKKMHEYEYVKSFIEKEGFVLKSKTYTNANTRLRMQCPKGHECNITFHNFKDSGTRCRKCGSSKGEKEVRRILDCHSIPYEDQYRFKDCKYKKPLPFDFYLSDYNLAIEYDGIQHHEPRSGFDGEAGFKLLKLKDSIKDDYCKINGISLLRIPYWDFENIEEIILTKIKEINKEKLQRLAYA